MNHVRRRLGSAVRLCSRFFNPVKPQAVSLHCIPDGKAKLWIEGVFSMNKRLVSALLALVLVFSLCLTAAAAITPEGERDPNYYYFTDRDGNG